MLLLVAACGPVPCSSDGSNDVSGTTVAAAAGFNCAAEVRGRIYDDRGQSTVLVWCARPDVEDPRARPERELTVVLSDPRLLDAGSSVRATEAQLDVKASLKMLEAAGAKASLPQAVTDDFSRHFVVTLTETNGVDVTVDVSMRASDLRRPARDCGAD